MQACVHFLGYSLRETLAQRNGNTGETVTQPEEEEEEEVEVEVDEEKKEAPAPPKKYGEYGRVRLTDDQLQESAFENR